MSDSEIITSITERLSSGTSKEEIFRGLLDKGLTVDTINDYLLRAIQSQLTDTSREHTAQKTITIILTIGAILVGIGIFSFIASNWQQMPKFIKLSIIILSMTLAYMTGWQLKHRSLHQKTGDALIFLGLLIYGAGIFLIGQMFNIRANWPDGFILWMFGSLLLGYALDTYMYFHSAFFLGLIALIGHPFILASSFSGSPFLLTSTFLLLAATAVTYVLGVMIQKKTPVDHKKYY